MKSKGHNGFRTVFAHVLLVILSFMCLFFFYILFVNSTRSHADLQKGFSALPGSHFFTNLRNVTNDGNFPMAKGILNSLIVSGCSAAICTYFSALTAYG
ncbi:MAG: carbohydrate ABC transporter permease, partial [Lachnospiraceae bacterium]|nr:carbohydrate ABC transporter permease [Lachnospiraceae bacterium]